MSLVLPHPEQEVEKIVEFVRHTFRTQGKERAVVAVSGGIDSALSLTLVTMALGSKNVIPVLLPYSDQNMDDGYTMIEHNHIPRENWHDLNIQIMVQVAAQTLMVSDADQVRLGNLKARSRMIAVYDIAKKEEALVCGTENKSEHYLGYFTRFGDAASDVEPISQLYKTQVRQLATFLQLPNPVIEKAPSAGLWAGQTDEEEMGFSYEDADKVLEQFIDQGKTIEQIQVEGLDPQIATKVIAQVQAMAFKRSVPFEME